MGQPSVKKNFILSTVFQVISMIAPFVTAPYVSRVLGADGVGIYSYTSSLQYYFAMFAALGTNTYGAREIARARNDEDKRSQLFWEIEALTAITTIVCSMVWICVSLLQKQNQMYYLILTLNVWAVFWDISWLYTGLEHFEHVVLQNTFFKLLGIICIFAFVRVKDDLPIYMVILSLSILLGNVSMWIYLPKYVKRVKFSQIRLMRHFKETCIYFLPTLATSIYTVLDKSLIGLITKDNFQNGYYEQATKIVNMAKMLCFAAINSAQGARISFLFAENKFEEVKRRIDQSISYIFFMGIGIWFGMIGVAPKFVPWFFGKEYEPAVFLLYIFAPISLIIGISNCLGSHYYTPAGLRAQSTKFLIVGSVINFVLNCILIPIWGGNGAAIASVVAELVITILYLKYCKGYLTVKQLFIHIWKKIIAGLIMLLVIIGINVVIDDYFFAIILDLCLGCTIYMCVLAFMHDSFIEVLLGLLRRKKDRGQYG